ncbi:MAG: ATP-binding protein [Spirochaetia bacterium]
MNPSPSHNSDKAGPSTGAVIVLTSRGADADVILRTLELAGIGGIACRGVDDLRGRITGGADAAIITDEMLFGSELNDLKEILAREPNWSYFPIIILSGHTWSPLTVWNLVQDLDYSGQIQILDRPLHTAELISAVRAALNARSRQYQVRDELKTRREMERQLKKESRRKNEFLAVLGHELRNPLAVAAAAVDRLGSVQGTDRRRRYKETLKKQVAHLQRLVDDLVDISRITRGKIFLQLEDVDLLSQMETAVESVYPLTSAKSQNVRLSPPEKEVRLRADPIRLQQIFGNLLKNGSQFTPEGGEIRFSAEADGNEAVIIVRDNGVGIEPEQMSLLFEPFMTDRAGGDLDEGGLGIGLSVVKQLVELHGGTVEASSEGPLQGSEFIVRLPLSAGSSAPENTASLPEAELPRRPGERRTILIAEDNADFAELLRETLEDEGHDVDAVETGEKALDKAAAEKPEFMIIDIGLSDMDGYTLAERIREIPDMDKAVLIALSGYAPDTRKSERLFDHYIVKGTDIEKIFPILDG